MPFSNLIRPITEPHQPKLDGYLRKSICMKRAFVWLAILASSSLPASAQGPDLAELDEHLRFLEPLMGHQWEGGYVGEDVLDLVISLRFAPVLGGRAVKYTREAGSCFAERITGRRVPSGPRRSGRLMKTVFSGTRSPESRTANGCPDISRSSSAGTRPMNSP